MKRSWIFLLAILLCVPIVYAQFTGGGSGSGSGAPTDATFIMQTANGSTSAEQALGSLASGCLSVTTTTGVIASSGAACGTGGTNALLDGVTHTDTLAGTVVRGDIVCGNSTPKWARLARGTTGQVLFTNSSGDCEWGSVDISSTTVTFTEKTLNAESSGNVITLPKRVWFPAAGCNNATAGTIWDLPTSSPAVAACVTGTNTQKGVLEFANSGNLSAQTTYLLPTTWTGTIDARIKWVTSATSGDVVWQLATICVADAETDDPAFNTASTVTDTAKGTTLQTNDAAITTVTVTGCAAGELMHVKILRDSGHASDTLAATAQLIGVELVIREAM